MIANTTILWTFSNLFSALTDPVLFFTPSLSVGGLYQMFSAYVILGMATPRTHFVAFATALSSWTFHLSPLSMWTPRYLYTSIASTL
ncbi:hypothetical protein P691DRAFT_759092 [Macrolepiota fuliginosa MF-IS2]|uniref:Uncharacterized protein n=1 Tax=Macrolepiota fuliginosa MF-IS2 TaxID=1400762 RepID=A0A9P5XHQ3_9AGAR|nr:hypothetical protein P691DRAFT_759092 [Macrolepiota fuliginosa MF-IS2]